MSCVSFVSYIFLSKKGALILLNQYFDWFKILSFLWCRLEDNMVYSTHYIDNCNTLSVATESKQRGDIEIYLAEIE